MNVDDHRTGDGDPGPLAAHLDAFGSELSRAAHRPAPRRRGWRAPAFGLGGLAVATAAVLAVLLLPVSARIDVLGEAQAALGRPDGILHYAVTFEGGMVPKTPRAPLTPANQRRRAQIDACKADGPPELWRTTSGPLRWRMVLPGSPCAMTGMRGHQFSGGYEVSYAGGARLTYDAEGRWLLRQTKLREADRRAPRFYGDGLINSRSRDADPMQQIRDLLAAGRLRDAGTIREPGGRLLRRLTAQVTPRGQARTLLEYRVDAATFAPVALTSTFRRSSYVMTGPGRPRTRQLRIFRYTLRFSRYERIPLTPRSERLLAVQPAPGVERVSMTSAEIASISMMAGRSTAAQRRQGLEAMRRHDRLHPRPPVQTTP